MSDQPALSRRGFFVKLGILFNGLVAAALAVPVSRFLFSSVSRGRGSAYLSWVPLGQVANSLKARREWPLFAILT